MYKKYNCNYNITTIGFRLEKSSGYDITSLGFVKHSPRRYLGSRTQVGLWGKD